MTPEKALIDYNDIQSWISDWEFGSVDYLSDLEPQSQNLFCVGKFGQYAPESGKDNLDETVHLDAHFRIRKITLPGGADLDIKNNKLTHIPQIEGAQFNWEVTVDWVDDVYHNVYFYHQEWQKCWYNRLYDTLMVGPRGKFRYLDIVAFHYKPGSDNADSIIAEPTIEPVTAFRIAGMVPVRVPGLTYDYYSDQNDQAFSVTYKCGLINEVQVINGLGTTNSPAEVKLTGYGNGKAQKDEAWGKVN